MEEEHTTHELNLSNNPFGRSCANSSEVSLHVKATQSARHRILCVDDEIIGTTMRGEILKEHGYTIVLHHCPLTALSSDLSTFDLAILDFQMPGLNGRELLLRMRARGVRFPIVLLTGDMNALSYEDRVLFARCIDKGVPIRYLLETIAEYLGPNKTPDYGA
jgi:CheY-like chemotaxis protein